MLKFYVVLNFEIEIIKNEGACGIIKVHNLKKKTI